MLRTSCIALAWAAAATGYVAAGPRIRSPARRTWPLAAAEQQPPPPHTTRRRALSAAAAGLLGAGLTLGRPAASRAMWQLWFPSDQLDYVERYSTVGNASSVLGAMDYTAETSWMMNMGAEKGAILEGLLDERSPPCVLEIGSFCGYSSIRIAREMGRQMDAGRLPKTAEFVTIEKDPETARVALACLSRAGIQVEGQPPPPVPAPGQHPKMTLIVGVSDEVLPKLARQRRSFDFVLMDHWKELYGPDIQRLGKLGLVARGTAVLADNIVIPGAPDYLKYLYSDAGSKLWETSLISVPFEYRPETPDAMSFSVRR